MKKLMAIAAALMAAGGVQAQTALPVYAELGYVGLTYSENGVPDIKPGVLRMLVGVEVHPNVAIEGMLGAGVKDDTVRLSGIDVKAKVDSSYGFFIKPKINPTSDLTLFARLGYSNTRIKASAMGVSVSDSGGDASYGVGLSYAFTKNAFAAVDYMSYYNKDGVKIDGFSFGLGYKF